MYTERQFASARRAITQEIGAATVAQLHRPAPVLDWLAVAVLWGAFFGLMAALATLPLGPLFVVALIAQGFVLQGFGYAVHELFVHRRLGGPRVSYVLGVLMELPVWMRRSAYEVVHKDHHRRLGSDEDEDYKQHLDTRWKRLFFLTLPGMQLTLGRKLRPAGQPATPGLLALSLSREQKPELRARVRQELWWLRLFLVGVIAAGVFWPRPVLLGYLLPLTVITPAINGVRLVLEHAETHPEHWYQCATYYRTGLLTRVLFFWDAGDCHLVHHIFPGVPFYRMGQAVELLRPVLTRMGAREHRSLWRLLRGYFIDNHAHRGVWPI